MGVDLDPDVSRPASVKLSQKSSRNSPPIQSSPGELTPASSVPQTPELGPTKLNGNAAATPQLPPVASPVPRGSISNQLQRMFSRSGRKDSSKEGIPQVNGGSDSETGNGVVSLVRKISNADRPSGDRKLSTDKKGSIADGSKPGTPTAPLKRFEVLTDGTHEHHLKGAKRQEKLGNMLRDLVGAKKKEDHAEIDGLNLVSSWVDQLKADKERIAADRKGGPNNSATLIEKYGKCQEVVGRGAFGIVRISHKFDHENREQLFAVKEFRRRPQESAKKYTKRLTSEFCISSSLRHPNIIHTLDLIPDAKGDFCEVMEFCAGGDLYSLILANQKLESAEADCYFKQLMRGVEYMHEMGVAHRDLKPENLLLTKHGALKISDFGNGECFKFAWEREAHKTCGLCGSAPYISPEEYTEKEFDPRAVDVWATGVIYMAMRTGRHLWRIAKKDEDEFFEKYLEGRKDEGGYGPIESLHRSKCRNVIYSILDPNPSRRITASQVLKSEWGRSIKLCHAGEEGF